MAEVAETARLLTLETADKIEILLKSVEKIPRSVAATICDHPYQQKELVDLLYEIVGKNPEIFRIAIAFEPRAFDPQAYFYAPYAFRESQKIKIGFLGGESNQNYFNYDWYKHPKGRDHSLWSGPYRDKRGGNILLYTFSTPFYQNSNGDRKFRGVVAVDIPLMWLQDLVSAVKIHQHDYAFLISPNGTFLTHPDKQLIIRESIFSAAQDSKDPVLLRIGQEMLKGCTGFVPMKDFFSGKKSWMYYAPLPSTGWSMGVVFPEDGLLTDLTALNRNLVVICLLGMCFLGVVSILIAASIASPLRLLAKKTVAIAQGDFTATVPETGVREVVYLARSFNEMGRQLTIYIAKRDFIRDTFGRYVTHEVVKRLLESKESLELGGETREVSIIMSDLRGFSALTADMDPEQVITFLNRYLGKMIEILMDHQAVIDEIIGDGILAFFGAPELQEDHPARAVACALQMQVAMDEINALNEADGLPHLEMGIGVNTGTVVVGNIGSAKRAKYSVVGAEVNFASRTESFSVGGQVLIGPNTYERVKDLVEVRDIILVEMKGVTQPATLYDIRGIGGSFNLQLKEKNENLVLLPEEINVLVSRISNKIVTGTIGRGCITHICETAALVSMGEKMKQWEDVRISLQDKNLEEIPGHIYGKVAWVEPFSSDLFEATIGFTSVSPEIYQIIRTDPLTRLANRRYFLKILDKAMTFAVRCQQPLTIIIANLDHFKTINDSFGHDVGDRVLKAFAKMLTDSVRKEDLSTRYGSEEFMILLPGTDCQQAAVVLKRLRRSLENLDISGIDRRLTVSFGVTQFQAGDTAETFTKRAEEALYGGKELDRNLA